MNTDGHEWFAWGGILLTIGGAMVFLRWAGVVTVLGWLGCSAGAWAADNSPGSRVQIVPGQAASDLRLQNLFTSEVTSLRAMRGKPVLMEFWGPGCVPCQPAMSRLNEFATTVAMEYHPSPSPIRIIAVSSGDGTTELDTDVSLRKAVARKEWTQIEHFRCAWPDYDSVVNQFAIPVAVLVDAEGVVLWVGNPGRAAAELEERLRTLLSRHKKETEKSVRPG